MKIFVSNLNNFFYNKILFNWTRKISFFIFTVIFYFVGLFFNQSNVSAQEYNSNIDYGLQKKFPITNGSVSLDGSLITPLSSSDLEQVQRKGIENRSAFDRRAFHPISNVKGFTITKDFYIFEARFIESRSIEVLVNTEFNSWESAEATAKEYSFIVGQIPRACRKNLEKIWIHKGDENAGGGNKSILIHTDRLENQKFYKEEIILHECAHTSLDWNFNGIVSKDSWSRAAAEDNAFISQYAQDFPEREDVAETWGAYIITKVKECFSVSALIKEQIPNRLRYFDSLNMDLRPLYSFSDKNLEQRTEMTCGNPKESGISVLPRFLLLGRQE